MIIWNVLSSIYYVVISSLVLCSYIRMNKFESIKMQDQYVFNNLKVNNLYLLMND